MAEVANVQKVGDFYEAWGIDACVLVEYAGLNPFGGLRSDSIPRAGCPVVCIVEEVQGPTQVRSRKRRFISGHAHPGNPYVYGLAAVDHDLNFPEPMPVVGISHSARGYCINMVLETMKTYSSEDCLTEEAVVTKLPAVSSATNGGAGAGDSHDNRRRRSRARRQQISRPADDARTCNWGEFGEGGLLWGECSSRHFDWFDGNPVSDLLAKVKELYSIDDEVTFRNTTVSSGHRARPLTLGTSTQIGAIPTEGIPSLLKVLLPSNCNGLPLVKLLEWREVNHMEFCRIKNVLDEILQMYSTSELNEILKHLIEPTWVATGLEIDFETLVAGCEIASSKIGEIVSLDDENDQKINSFSFIPHEFFEDMESKWKGRIKRIHIDDVFTAVEKAAEALHIAVTEDFVPVVSRIKAIVAPLGGPKGEISYAREQEAVWFKGKRFTPNLWAGSPGEEQIKQLRHALDSKGRKVGEEWFTTPKVEAALTRYHEANAKAKERVLEILRGLAAELQYMCGNVLRDVKSLDKTHGMKISGLLPYWFHIAEGVVRNDVDMQSLFLLTGPNGGGKSSFLRSICAAALLGICGLMVPAESALIPYFDSITLHMKSYDSPADKKSSFQVEMSELRSIIGGTTNRSLVLVDEICRGTETAKGTCIAGSIIETLDGIGCLGIVSTHLHGIFTLPLNKKNTVHKAMGTTSIDGQIMPTWKLTDGVCKESLAFETAKREGIPEHIVRRAEYLYQLVYAKEMLFAENFPNEEKFSTCINVNNLNGTHLHSKRFLSGANQMEVLREEVERAVTVICQDHIKDLKCKKIALELTEIKCLIIGTRELPPPSVVGSSSVYVMFRPDKKLYVGENEDHVVGGLGQYPSQKERNLDSRRPILLRAKGSKQKLGTQSQY
ncbi:hypothetical protein JHK84_028273 [Glycine max]|nr:hypothetical protein JHK84_028273 [Glycine max]